MKAFTARAIRRRVAGNNVWLSHDDGAGGPQSLASLTVQEITPCILDNEAAVGRAMLQEIEDAGAAKPDDLVIIILGGRGAQALHRLLGEMAQTSDADPLLRRLHVFTQDALAPMSMNNGLSFVRDFERLL